MPNVRTTCPTCDVVVVESPALTVRLHAFPEVSEAVFVCPQCDAEVVHPLDEHMVPVLIGAGCPVDDPGGSDLTGPGPVGWHPSFGLEITESEIDRFVTRLDRDDWFEELIH